ncbi:hypothetical protein Rumeso_03126 [Rubellimicrobium mesophilum DSM 19309]|uniref:Uncharacterized protein n=1 Tax=Rubellimicrobium mesophilum DSM 19309 TaxID=442562 RepID=A0A017HLB0_9RHOB|nr:hypothetical protein Rumeso_03126 [Rubellimicrobium mesophilum DSM 19309]
MDWWPLKGGHERNDRQADHVRLKIMAHDFGKEEQNFTPDLRNSEFGGY